MSLYNMLNGMNAVLAILVTPFLPRQPTAFPRFRDVFLGAEDLPKEIEHRPNILVYTRMGSGNATCWGQQDGGQVSTVCQCPACDAERLEEHPDCYGSYEDASDSTYRTFVFHAKDGDRADYDCVRERRIWDLSDDYRKRLTETFAASPPDSAVAKLVAQIVALREKPLALQSGAEGEPDVPVRPPKTDLG